MKITLTLLVCLISWTASAQYTQPDLWRMMMLPKPVAAGDAPSNPDGTFAYWTTASGDLMLDVIGGNTATNQGGATVSGNTFAFDGTDDYWLAGPLGISSNAGTFWFWAKATEDRNLTICGAGESYINGRWFIQRLAADDGGNGVYGDSLFLRFSCDGGNLLYTTTNNLFPADSAWHWFRVAYSNIHLAARVWGVTIDGVDTVPVYWTGLGNQALNSLNSTSMFSVGFQNPGETFYMKGNVSALGYSTQWLSPDVVSNELFEAENDPR